MIKVGIVDDDTHARDLLRKSLKDIEKKESVFFDVSEYDNAEKLLFSYDDSFDLLLLDIEMPGEDGLSAARKIRQKDSSVIIIFVTNMAQYALQGYEVEALDFIVKPFNPSVFYLKIKRAIGRIAVQNEEMVVLKVDGESKAIRTKGIHWFEKQGHYVIYHSVEGVFSEYSTLSNAEKKIHSSLFVPCNRGTYVNLCYLSSIGKDNCVVSGETLFLSGPLRKKLMQSFTAYLGGMIK